jgi:hypothetical protein
MGKHADGPASGRIGYGFEQARAAGAPFVASRSGKQMNADLIESNAASKLHEIVKADPEWAPFVEHWIRDGLSATATADAISRARSFMSFKAKAFSLAWRLRYFW